MPRILHRRRLAGYASYLRLTETYRRSHSRLRYGNYDSTEIYRDDDEEEEEEGAKRSFKIAENRV